MATFTSVAPISAAVTLTGRITVDPSDRFTEVHAPAPPMPRASSVVTVSAVKPPVIVNGRPTMPAQRVLLPVGMTATQGPAHIRSVADPAPVWDPNTGTWTRPPGPAGVGDYRWTVSTLLPPQDFVDGQYLLGDRSVKDETDELPIECTAWFPDAATPGPAWKSAYPFKPTVMGRSAKVNGKLVVHPVGVMFNPGDAAHMWLDMGANKPQPFTWVIVAYAFPETGAPSAFTIRKPLLDSGRDPYAVGLAVPTDAALSGLITVNDNLTYRTTVVHTGGNIAMSTKAAVIGGSDPAPLVVTPGAGYRPRMYAAIFDSDRSQLYIRDQRKAALTGGPVVSGVGYNHRYYVLGRGYGSVGAMVASTMMVFEIRFWARALSKSELDSQYTELASTYQFARYP